MADRRIRIAKDAVPVIRRLVASDDSTGPFRTIAEALGFAAALGAARGAAVALGEVSRDHEPIRQAVFEGRGLDTLLNLLAIYGTQDPRVLAWNDEAEDRRVTQFEEYANGGLRLLDRELEGHQDVLEHLVLLIQAERTQVATNEEDEFDLAALLG